MKRVFLLVMDGAGCGELPDAGAYGDAGSHTLGHVCARYSGPDELPTLWRLGLFNIDGMEGLPPCPAPTAKHMRLAERSAGKDTTIGHWELAGLVSERPLPTYPGGFPQDFIDAFTARIGRGVLGNCVASGTEIIARLGEEHMRTGCPIVYTSADSVFQIAAHEDIIPCEQLYDICRTAREMLDVGRVIARPFTGAPGSFVRTEHRRDFSLLPPEPNLLTRVRDAGMDVVGVGKIEDIFAFRGLTRSYHTGNSADSMNKAIELAAEDFAGLVFVNLIDFDMLYGHRNDMAGYAAELRRLDGDFARLMAALAPDDCMMITADHGCDPSTPSTDHSREYVPLLVYARGIPPENAGTAPSFAAAADMALDMLGVSRDR